MHFEFNENGCKAIKGFFEEKIETLEKEIETVRQLMKPATDPQVRLAFLYYIGGLEKRLAECRFKVAEMDGYLEALKAGNAD